MGITGILTHDLTSLVKCSTDDAMRAPVKYIHTSMLYIIYYYMLCYTLYYILLYVMLYYMLYTLLDEQTISCPRQHRRRR